MSTGPFTQAAASPGLIHRRRRSDRIPAPWAVPTWSIWSFRGLLPFDFVMTCLVLGAISVVGVVLLPAEHRGVFYKEGQLIENLTAGFFLLGGLLALALVLKPELTRSARLWVLAVALIGIAGAGDEIDWGQRLLGFKSVLIAGHELDTLHDVVGIWQRTAGKLVVGCAMVGIYVSPIVALYTARHTRAGRAIISAIRQSASVRLILVFSLAAGISLTLDARLVPWFPGNKCVEAFIELIAGLAVLFAAIELRSEGPRHNL